jgi:hypothetical protein
MQCEPADEHVNRRELAKDAHCGWVDGNFLGRFPECRLSQGLTRICRASGETDLASVSGEAAAAHGQCHRGPVVVRIEQQQRGCLSRFCRQLSCAPRVFEHFGRKPDLRVDARQRFCQPVAEQRLDFLQPHDVPVCL